jgi:hypothetical protein
VLYLYIIAIHAPCTILLISKASYIQPGSEQRPLWIIHHMARIPDQGSKPDRSFKPHFYTNNLVPSLNTFDSQFENHLLQETVANQARSNRYAKGHETSLSQRVGDTHISSFFHFNLFWQTITHLQRSTNSNLHSHPLNWLDTL